jgi:hypothetical protein
VTVVGKNRELEYVKRMLCEEEEKRKKERDEEEWPSLFAWLSGLGEEGESREEELAVEVCRTNRATVAHAHSPHEPMRADQPLVGGGGSKVHRV